MTNWIRTRKELAEAITTMTYGELLDVANELHEMNAGEYEGLRDMTTKYGMAGTLFDWAEATMDEILADEAAAKAKSKAA